jgi:hypothetical protein
MANCRYVNNVTGHFKRIHNANKDHEAFRIIINIPVPVLLRMKNNGCQSQNFHMHLNNKTMNTSHKPWCMIFYTTY